MESIDVRNIISDDTSLQAGVLPALREYNIAQFITVDVPGTDHQVCREIPCLLYVLSMLHNRRLSVRSRGIPHQKKAKRDFWILDPKQASCLTISVLCVCFIAMFESDSYKDYRKPLLHSRLNSKLILSHFGKRKPSLSPIPA